VTRTADCRPLPDFLYDENAENSEATDPPDVPASTSHEDSQEVQPLFLASYGYVDGSRGATQPCRRNRQATARSGRIDVVGPPDLADEVGMLPTKSASTA